MSAHLWIRTAPLIALAVAAGLARAQVLEPTPPKRYDATIRYLITSTGNQRILDYRRLEKLLADSGFVRTDDPEPEDAVNAEITTMSGTVPPGREQRLLRTPFVRGVLLKPEGVALPADAKQAVTVEVRVKPSDARDWRQRLERLRLEGFQENVGYDDQSHTRLVGRVAVSKVTGLLPPVEFARLKGSPHGGVVTYLPDPAGAEPTKFDAPAESLPAEKAHLRKVSPELREKLGAKDDSSPRRLEVILQEPEMATGDDYLRELIRAAESPGVEHTFGPIVSLVVPGRAVEEVAKLPFVQAVRSPRPATASVQTAPASQTDLAGWSVEKLHQKKAFGQGVQVVVIGDDFRGWERLPKGTRLVDLTAERDPKLLPEPVANGKDTGDGTAQALAVASVAPQAKLVLVRINRSSPYQIVEVSRLLRGKPSRSPALLQRGRELARDEEKLQQEQALLVDLRRAAIEIPPEDADPERRKLREDYEKRRDAHEAETRAYAERRSRYFALLESLALLKPTKVVVNGLVWNDGYPTTGAGELSEELAAGDPCGHVWIQAAGDAAGQTWSGAFREDDRDGVLEFAAPDAPAKPGRWSRQLNFLGWRPHSGEAVVDLPAGATIRLSAQWREAYDPLLRRLREPAYNEPSSSVGFVVLRQRDPLAKSLPTDAMAVVRRSPPRDSRLVERVHFGTNQAVYEHSLEFKADVAGRYAVLLEGIHRDSIRPEGDETLPGDVRRWEMRPRVFVQAVEAELRRGGRPVWLDYPASGKPADASFGTPADAQRVVVVGAGDAKGSRPYSPSGSPFGMALRRRPELLLPDAVPLGVGDRTGTAISAGYAGGVAAAAISAGAGVESLSRAWRGREQAGWALPPGGPGR